MVFNEARRSSKVPLIFPIPGDHNVLRDRHAIFLWENPADSAIEHIHMNSILLNNCWATNGSTAWHAILLIKHKHVR